MDNKACINGVEAGAAVREAVSDVADGVCNVADTGWSFLKGIWYGIKPEQEAEVEKIEVKKDLVARLRAAGVEIQDIE